MKNVIAIIGTIIFVSVMLTSCSDSIENDAKKLAELQCKAQKIMQKATTGDLAVIAEGKKLASDEESLSEELEKKYTTDSDKKKFEVAFLKEQGNCK